MRSYGIMLACLLLAGRTNGHPDKLSANQMAPVHARSSAGRALPLPSGGSPPANVNRLPGGGAARPNAGPAAPGPPQEEGVQREESVSFKEVDGETVRVVEGTYGYQSPEGLPVSFKYMADENGNKASFTIGKAAGAGGGGGAGGAKPSPGRGPGGAGAGGGGVKGGKGGADGGDRQYLPPS
ncbi:uncharacterized protein LOC106636047 [Copidosoma floridanum]|uniref:uncharacterized protein LOC106636047 n=1 Tax=Copidosoma floridanum TaxID=29053 RepID=UPI0006C95484|nr:uncharacterized protein LOC106636047 [Copidosoma floridanum]